MKFTTIALSAALACTTLMGVSTTSYAAHGEWYVGGGLGLSDTDINTSAIDADVVASGLVTTSTSTKNDDTELSAGLFFGYQFNEYLALEASFNYLAQVTVNNTTTGALGTGTFSNETDAMAYNLDALAFFPMNKKTSLYARLGISAWKADLDILLPGQTVATNDNDTDMTYGFGVQYRMRRHYFLRGEYRHFELGKVDIDNYTLSVVYQL